MSERKVRPLAVLSIAILSLLGSGAISAADNTAPEPATPVTVPAGRYTLDRSHSTIIFKVSHLGFSFYTGSFSQFDATLDFDPAHLETTDLTATVDVNSLGIPKPPEGFLSELLGPNWLNADQFPQMTFRSTKVTRTGTDTAQVTGDLKLNGKTAPVTFAVNFNGGYAGMADFDPNARVGFSAHGSLDRSVFGIEAGLPPEGSTMGVGDQVTFMIETEFTGPPLVASSEKN